MGIRVENASQLQRQYPPEAPLSPDPSRRRWAAAEESGGGGRQRLHESEASLNLEFETADDHPAAPQVVEQIELQYR